ncbi:hypothetical protein SSP531S_18360 [Streptomyces spongiicola]|uniref:DUF6542 domain-containing protein n=1 Tax=Streptomyces spongiicola TaxID=1690221 RepID=A0A2S1Z4B4_9ACTN|nr:DUF6542 domain-containing protein [Streptomyces spongiicola]AWK11204.1 hypothetical protein DDQ41_22365 [Streptomyces spongiicola]GBQ00421.1 hypothetical protein SSP531S_18360 [Streptomyces spongiicola]
MEQQRTGTPSRQPRPQAPLSQQAPLSKGALIEGASVQRVAARPGGPGQPDTPQRTGKRPARQGPPMVAALRRLPNPRLTGLGAGLFACTLMLVIGSVDQLLFDGSAVVYGVLFLPVSALTGFWVRSADLVTAPISVPIAFAVGLVPITGGSAGTGGPGGIGVEVMAVVTALAVQAGWLYGGTLVAGLIATVRKIRLMAARRRARRPSGPPRRV